MNDKLVGIDVVVGAVEDGDLEVDDGVAGEVAARGRLHDALFDGRDEIARDCAAENFVGEFESGSARLRLHANFAVAELAVAAGLLFVAAVGLGLGANGFEVGNLGRLKRDLSVIALFEAADDGLDVRLACAGDEELVGLRIAVEANEQVFFHELVDGGRELVLVGAALGLDGVGHGGLGGLGHIHLEVAALCTERVAGERVAELAHCAEIAGVQLGDFNGLAALHDAQVREFFLAAARVVLKRGVVLDDAADDLEERDAAGERIGHGFEDHCAGWAGVVDFADDGGSVGGSSGRFAGKRFAFCRRGRVRLDEVEEMIEGHVAEAA